MILSTGDARSAVWTGRTVQTQGKFLEVVSEGVFLKRTGSIRGLLSLEGNFLATHRVEGSGSYDSVTR